jgi:hypothetical protein
MSRRSTIDRSSSYRGSSSEPEPKADGTYSLPTSRDANFHMPPIRQIRLLQHAKPHLVRARFRSAHGRAIERSPVYALRVTYLLARQKMQ